MGRVIAFSLTAAANPTLIAATTVLLILPSPKKLMLGYLAGALVTSITLGIVIVRTLEDSGAVSTAKHKVNPIVDLALGAILLVVAVVLATDRDRRVREARARRKAQAEPKTPRWQQWLGRGNPKVTFAVGAVLTLPGASYLAALTSLAKLNYGLAGDVLVVVLINAVMLLLIEVPLVCFVVAPEWTPAAISRAKATMRLHGRRIALGLLLVIGSLLILRGVITLLA
jgi:Sap-like sulfolipid-1-addressing protein